MFRRRSKSSSKKIKTSKSSAVQLISVKQKEKGGKSAVTAESHAQDAEETHSQGAQPLVTKQGNINTSGPPPDPSHLPMKSQSTVHRKDMVITSACFDTQNLQECKFENQTMELEFKGLKEKEETNYPIPIRRTRTNTTISLKIDCSYEL